MDAWPRCLERLEAELPAEDVHTWLKPLQAGTRDDGFVLYAPNAFVMEEVRDRYLARIRELLAHFAGNPDVTLERSYRLTRRKTGMWYATRGVGALGLVGGLIAVIAGKGATTPTASPLPGAPDPPTSP